MTEAKGTERDTDCLTQEASPTYFFWKSEDLCKHRREAEVTQCHQGSSHTAGSIDLKGVDLKCAGKFSSASQLLLKREHH